MFVRHFCFYAWAGEVFPPETEKPLKTPLKRKKLIRRFQKKKQNGKVGEI
jgi:hypothetical protein